MSETTWNIWNTWTFCNRLMTYTIYDRSVCVNGELLKSTFNLGGNDKYPITKYCHYCGYERFTKKQIQILSNPDTIYNDIKLDSELQHITTKNINSIICIKSDCLLGLYNLNNKSVPSYDLDDISSHVKCNNLSTLGEILEKIESCPIISKKSTNSTNSSF